MYHQLIRKQVRLVFVYLVIACLCYPTTSQQLPNCSLQSNATNPDNSTDNSTVNAGLFNQMNWIHNNSNTIIYLIICPILVILQILVIATYLRYKQLFDKQGYILFVLVISQIALNLNIIQNAIFIIGIGDQQIATKTAMKSYQISCRILGGGSFFFQTLHFAYLFVFLFYVILLRHYGLKKKSNSFWRVLQFFVIVICVILTVIFISANLIGVNMYGLCGFTTILNGRQTSNALTLISTIFYICICGCFLLLGIFAYTYLNKQLPSSGKKSSQAMQDTQNNLKCMLLIFVFGYSSFQFCISIFNMILAIDCTQHNSYFLIISIKILKPFEYCFTLFIILMNVKFRQRFKRLLKNISGFLYKKLVCTKKQKIQKSLSTTSKDQKQSTVNKKQKTQMSQSQIKRILVSQFINMAVSSDIDLSLAFKIHTLLRGIYMFSFEYLTKYRDENRSITRNSFKQHLTLQIDEQLSNKYDNDEQHKYHQKLKIIKCKMTFHFPRVSYKLLELDQLQNIYQSFKTSQNLINILDLSNIEKNVYTDQFIFYTADNKFILQTLTDEEFQFMKENFQLFYQHYNKNNKSLILKIYCLMTIKINLIEQYNMVLIKNSYGCQNKQDKQSKKNPIIKLYEIKGGNQSGKKKKKRNKRLKIDVLNTAAFKLNERILKIKQQQRKQLMKNLIKDVQFLKTLYLVNYSLNIVFIRWQNQPQNKQFWNECQRIKQYDDEKQFDSEQQDKNYYHIQINKYYNKCYLKKSLYFWQKILYNDVSLNQSTKYCQNFISCIEDICCKNISERELKQYSSTPHRKKLTVSLSINQQSVSVGGNQVHSNLAYVSR